MFSKKRQVRLPPVRRRAGESLSEERERRVFDKLPPIVFLPTAFWIVWFTQQLQLWKHTGPQPGLWLWIAIVATVVAAAWFWRLLPIARRLNRGERGERYVADVLEELRVDGYKPVHDLVADGFNIDHVLVGPGGVFAIETKYRSGKGDITFRNGGGLFVDGRQEEKDCLKQVRGAAREVNRLIRKNCGVNEWVWPLVVFVGDWRIKDDWRDTDTRVLTPDRLIQYIRNQQPRLKRSEIDLIASHLERSASA
jgi:hypothetical protein